MRNYGDDLLKLAGYENDPDDLNIIQKSYWSDLRSYLFKKICKGKGGRTQWEYITGKRSRNADGTRIQLTEDNTRILESLVAYYETDEGREELEKYDIHPIPEHPDDLIEKISEALPDRKMKREEFKLFLKHKDKIMRFLLRY